MRAPNDKPTEKALAKAGIPIPDTQDFVEVDLNTLLEKILGSEHVQEELTIAATKRLDTEEAKTTVKAIMSEYLSSYIILGYDVNKDRIVIKHTPSDQDDDSIIELIRYALMKLINGS